MKHFILALCVIVALAGSAAAQNFKMNSLGVGTNPSGSAGQIDATTIKASGLTSGQCVQAGSGGVLASTGSACGSGSGTVTSVGGTAPISSSGGATPSISLSGVTSEQGNGAKVQLSTGSTTTNHCVKYDANGNTVDAGGACSTTAAPACTTLSGATPTLTPTNTTDPTKECFTEVLSANTTLTSFASGAAPVHMWTAHLIFTQPSGAHNWTLTFTAGSGEVITYPATGGCAALPTMPTTTGHSLTLDVMYNTNPASPEIIVLSCPTT